jgi:hypothetical protein
VLGSTAIFCLDARAELTQEEQKNVARYKLGSQVIYNSEASRKALERSEREQNGSTVGALKSLAFTALAAMKLNISINSLQQGQHIECKSLDELLGAEEALMTACQNLKGYLEAAASFDGREVLIDFSTDGAVEVANASPAPALAYSGAAPPPPAAIATAPLGLPSPQDQMDPAQVAFPAAGPSDFVMPPPRTASRAPDANPLAPFLAEIRRMMAQSAAAARKRTPFANVLIMIGGLLVILTVGLMLKLPIIIVLVLLAGSGYVLKQSLAL